MVKFSRLLQKLLHFRAHKLRKLFHKITFSLHVTSVETQAPDLPWLMLTFQSFFSFSRNNFCFLDLKEAQGKRICGSSRGWLIMLGETSSEISMLNPLTRAQIHLPPLSQLGHGSATPPPTTSVHKALIFSEPDCTQFRPIVVLIYGESRELAFHKKGDKKWTPIRDAGEFYNDAISYGGELYAVDDCGRVVLCEFGSSTVGEVVARPWFFRGDKVYLVALHGDLHLIIRFLDLDPDLGYKTSHFKVYKLNIETEKWQLIRCLGDYAIFLGPNQSISLCARHIEGLRGNCIYFMDDCLAGLEDCVVGGHDLGVFSLDEQSVEPLLCPINSKLFWPPPIWFTSDS